MQPPDPTVYWTANVPEYNDCQRLLVNGGGDFTYQPGPAQYGLFAVFAHPGLDTLPARLDPVGCAVVVPGCSIPAEDLFTTDAAPAAWISAEMDYSPLGIAPGANCLLLYRSGGEWKATIVAMSLSASPITCFEDLHPNEVQGYELSVHEIVVPGLLADEHYPPVARWDWDGVARRHYIGLKCGAAWCEVGHPDGITSSSAHPEFALSNSSLQRRTVLIKGWYDEQYLAFDAGARLVPTDILATTFPDSLLGTRDSSDFRGNWLHISRIALSVDLESADTARNTLNRAAAIRYNRKFNLDTTEFAGKLNELFMCFGTKESCDIDPDVQVGASCGAGDNWWVRIEGALDAPGDPGMYVCATHYAADPDPMTGQPYDVPGAVRWRWMPTDEGEWSRCPAGCCEVLGFGGP